MSVYGNRIQMSVQTSWLVHFSGLSLHFVHLGYITFPRRDIIQYAVLKTMFVRLIIEQIKNIQGKLRLCRLPHIWTVALLL